MKESACLRCHVAVTTGHGLEWSNGVERCQQDADFNRQVDDTCSQVALLESGKKESLKRYPNPSAVDSQQELGEISYLDIPFPTPEQFPTLSSLNVSQAHRQRLLGQRSLRGWERTGSPW